MENSEELPVVDSRGRVIGRASRSLCHSGSMILHPVVHIHIVSNGRLFLQKRSQNKKIEPGKWDTSVGGHVVFGSTVEESAFKEAGEELGITEKLELIPLMEYVWESPVEKEYVNVFKAYYSGTVRIDNDEVTDGRFFTEDEIENLIGRNFFTPNFEKEFEMIKDAVFR